MMGVLIPFPRSAACSGGTVHVMLMEGGGFEVGHESSSGSSWGFPGGAYAQGQDAIEAAYRLNRVEYGGNCTVSICPEALADAARVSALTCSRGDF